MEKKTGYETKQFFRTLAGFATSFKGQSAVLDLVNESSVAGRVVQVDP